MTKISLPNLNKQGKANEWSHVEGNDVAIQTVVNGELDNENIKAGANIARSKLEGGAQGVPGAWYTPSVIATEQTRENVAFGTLSTADEITGAVVPNNGLLVVGFTALVKSSVGAAGRIAIFIGSNQLKATGTTAPAVQEVATAGTAFTTVFSLPGGLRFSEAGGTSFVTTGQALADAASSNGGVCPIFLAAGTYAISVQYRATSGSVTAKERKLWAYVLGS